MSLASLPTTNKRATIAGMIALALSGTALCALTLVPASGAWFTDEKAITTVAHTGSMSMLLTADNGMTTTDGGLNFDLGMIQPGQARTEVFSVMNTGSIDGEVRLSSSSVERSGAPSSPVDDFEFTVDGANLTLGGGSAQSLNLGTLAAGESRSYTMIAQLPETAGNDWQGANIVNHMNLVLQQTS